MGTRYQEGDIVITEESGMGYEKGSRFEVIRIENSESSSPDYVLQSVNNASFKTTVKASEIRKYEDKGGSWKDKAVREFEQRTGLDATIESEDGDEIWIDTPEGQYRIFKNHDAARQRAEERTKQDLREMPNIFRDSFLRKYVYMTPTDRRMVADDESRAMVSHNLEDLKSSAESYDIDYKEYDDPERTKEELREKLMVFHKDRVQERLEEDPFRYFMDRGTYSKEELLDQAFIRIDEEEAAEAAVRSDGTTERLGAGKYVELPSGAEAYGIW